MTLSLSLLFGCGVCFLLLLFVIGFATNRNIIPTRISRHPAIFVLALGVYASAWTFYGAIGLAQDYGYAFLASYFGASASFMLAPVVLLPLLRIAKTYQLSSIADLFAFRFRSQLAGTLVTILMLLACLPLMSIQIESITDSTRILTGEQDTNIIALVFCLTIAFFSILFGGSRHPSIRHRTAGLVMAMAVGVLVKLLALLSIGLFAIYGVFGSNTEMERWLTQQAPQALTLYQPLEGDHWRTLLIGFMTSTVVMPHMFHLLFTENSDPQALLKASWGFPLLMLLLAIAIPPILWAGLALNLDTPPEYFGLMLGIATNTPALSLIAYIGGLAAACGVLIVATIALAGMTLNHLILPYLPSQGSSKIYSRLIWSRRVLILILSLLGYLFYRVTDQQTALHQMGLISFIAFIQFLPGLLATLFWPSGTQRGFIIGLVCGMLIWLGSMIGPMFPHTESLTTLLQINTGDWHELAILSLLINVILFITISSLSRPGSGERLAANSCALGALHRPQSSRAPIPDTHTLIQQLAQRLGHEVAQREVHQALIQLQLSPDEARSQQLEQLQDQLEINLSALLGPAEAISLLSPEQPLPEGGYRRRDIHLLEDHLEQSQTRLSGVAAELDELRRLHRKTLQHLPVGVCSLGEAGEVLLWNSALQHFTGVADHQVIGHRLDVLPSPWREQLSRFAQQSEDSRPNQRLTIDGQPRFFSLHKATLSDRETAQTSASNDSTSSVHPHANQVLLLEDETETQLLADELAHSERLASIGRLAAGVAHEVGNPITGIACLAQNLRYETEPQEIRQSSDLILEQTARVDNIVKSLMSFAHTGTQYRPGSQQNLSLHHCVKQSIELVKLDTHRKQLNYLNLCDSQLMIHGDQQRLLQVFVNLLNNAADASELGQSIRIQSYETDTSILIHIEDQGCGIPEELQKRLFEPFFTTKEPGKGTGLGLMLTYNIIEEHYGSVQIESPADVVENRGTRVILTLPKASSALYSDRDTTA